MHFTANAVHLALLSIVSYSMQYCLFDVLTHDATALHRFDVYMQLRGLLACEYNPAAPLHQPRTAINVDDSSSGSGSSSELLGYAEAQAAAFDAVDSTGAFGVNEVRSGAYCAHCSLLLCETAVRMCTVPIAA
jgi:hypothetical protein